MIAGRRSRMPLRNHALAPVVAFQRAVHGKAEARYPRQAFKAVFHLPVKRRQPVHRVARAHRVNVHHVAVRGLDAKVLVFQLGQRLGHQDGGRQQHHRKRRLKNHQRFLRQRRAIFR